MIRPARVVLWQHDPSTVREIVEALQLDHNTVSPLLKRLKTRGLLSRRRRADDAEASGQIVVTGVWGHVQLSGHDDQNDIRRTMTDTPRPHTDRKGQ